MLSGTSLLTGNFPPPPPEESSSSDKTKMSASLKPYIETLIAGDFFGRFVPGAEESEEAADLDLVGTLEDGAEGVVGFRRGQMTLAGDEGFDVGFEGGRHFGFVG